MKFPLGESFNKLRSRLSNPWKKVGSLIPMGISANQVTTISFLVALAGIFLLSAYSVSSFLIGTLLLQLAYLLEHVDGQIARYRKSVSLTGAFFSSLTRHLIRASLFFSLGYYSFKITDSSFGVVWGFVVSTSIFLLIFLNEAKSKPVSVSLLRRAFSFFYETTEIHVLINVLLVAAVLEVLFRFPWDTRLALLVFYGTVVPLLAVTKITYLILTRQMDEELLTAKGTKPL